MASVDSSSAALVDAGTSLLARARASARLRPERRAALTAGGAAIAFAAVAAAFIAFLPAHRPFHPGTAAVLIAVFAAASMVRFEVTTVYAIPTQLVFVPMALALPARTLPAAVALGYLLGFARELAIGSLRLSRLPLALGSSWYAVGPAIVLAVAGDRLPDWHLAPLLVLALATQFAFDYAATAAWTKAAYGMPLRAHLRETTLPWLVDVALAPVGLAIGLLAVHEGFAIVLVLPLVALLAYFARERHGRLDHVIELSSAYRGTALLLGDVIEADDAYTGSHSRAVVELTLAVCDQLGVDPETRRDAEFVALLHDVGKVRVPAELLNKPGPLDREERALMDAHTIEGERMLEQVGGLLGHVGHIVRSCHERWDGNGYPDGLAAEQVPLPARVVCCCDAFDAMTTDRPYRAALPLDEACEELRRNRGTQFDPTVVDALLAVVAGH